LLLQTTIDNEHLLSTLDNLHFPEKTMLFSEHYFSYF
jgi:hypothetical protein